ncbi:hypothetical protein GO495_27820 [Chitinophaga oryziterrae]|uniref:Uncharacterized protein n=1 Tax=Chitinophaga oryziterrae TaxID=1031224 RepID=A0A6N8JHI4_9BACT|nr:hypothetical protein [Chitinophaga oryziterrae]MVT44434.1 hypothetical protein [Chitinophaga oryziterrae]
MKQLKRLVLLISCLFLLQIVQGEKHGTVSSAQERLVKSTYPGIKDLSFGEKQQRFFYRTKALNDFHEQCFFVSSIRIRSHYVFIRSHYKGYTQSYISVAVSLNHWRGPPTA